MKRSSTVKECKGLFKLVAGVQNYMWGKIGSCSVVAQQKQADDSSFEIDEKKTYAELWMGTHPNCPSLLAGTEEELMSFLRRNEKFVGKVPSGYPSDDFPFLFKILSIIFDFCTCSLYLL